MIVELIRSVLITLAAIHVIVKGKSLNELLFIDSVVTSINLVMEKNAMMSMSVIMVLIVAIFHPV